MHKGKKIVREARSWIGTNYHHQGRLKQTKSHKGGVDCIGLIMEVANSLKIKGADNKPIKDFDHINYSAIPDGKTLQDFMDKHLISIEIDNIKDGDVLLLKLFKDPQHVGIKASNAQGNSTMIHCYSGSKQVVEHNISEAWQKMLVAVYRFKK